MGSEIIQRNIDELSIFFPDSDHDILTSTEIGLVEGVKYIHAGNGETSYRDGNLYVHIDGDPTKFSISELSYGSTFVTAIAFADLNGGLIRAGEEAGSGQGEILLMLLIDSNLPDSAMARAGITATEGITASLQDLGLAYSSLIPSGAVKQNILVIRDRGSRMYLRGAGKHTKLGELIGRSTIEAVKASAAENGVTIVNRMNLLGMLEPYGYDQEKLYNLSGSQDMLLFLVKVIAGNPKPSAIGAVSAALHIYHEVQWGLLEEETGLKVVRRLMRTGLLQDVSGMSILDTIATAVARYVAEN